jgi:phosphoribosyl 1,2-cyclic phosphodiesterase
VRVHLCGVRGSTPASGPEFVRYGGHTSCVAIAADDGAPPALVLDAGTGLRNLTTLLAGEPFVGTILLSHLHWDHFQGLPFFAAGDRDDAQVHLALPADDADADAEELLARAMSPPFFPVRPGQLRGKWTFEAAVPRVTEVDGFEVEVRPVPHKGGITFGHRIGDGRTTIAYVPDHCPTVLGLGPDGLGEYHPAALALASGADVLIHDAHLLAEEVETRASLGHAAAEYALGLAGRAGARLVVLFHHAPERDDTDLDRLAERFADSSPPVVVAAAGATIDLSRAER